MLKLTKHESSWLQIFTLLFFVTLGWTLISTIVTTTQASESLADPVSLRELLNGHQLPVPKEEKLAQYHGNFVTVPQLSLASNIQNVMGISNIEMPTLSDFKHIEVDLTSQKVYAFEGSNKVYEFSVSTGKWAPTPTGEFRIWAKVRSQKMEGGNKDLHTYYYLPNVPYVMFFYNNQIAKMRGFSLHGTYWHDNFGHPMSHGCINMKTAEAQTLYEWAAPAVTNPRAWSTLASNDNPGTKVIVYGITPRE